MSPKHATGRVLRICLLLSGILATTCGSTGPDERRLAPRDPVARALLDRAASSEPERAAPLEDHLHSIVRFQAVVDQYPDALSGHKALLAVAAERAICAERLLAERREDAEPMARGVVEACNRLAASPWVESDPVVSRLATEGKLLKGDTLRQMGRLEEAVATYHGVVDSSETSRQQRCRALWQLQLTCRDAGKTAEQITCLERVVRECETADDAYMQWAWRSAALALTQAYLELEPPGSELVEAHACHVLRLSPQRLGGEVAMQSLKRSLQQAQDALWSAPPERQVVSYLRLWRHGYYEAMPACVAPPLRSEGPPDALESRARRLADEGIWPQTIGPQRVTSKNGRHATVEVEVDFATDRPPEFVSGVVAFELAFSLTEDGTPRWVITRGPGVVAEQNQMPLEPQSTEG